MVLLLTCQCTFTVHSSAARLQLPAHPSPEERSEPGAAGCPCPRAPVPLPCPVRRPRQRSLRLAALARPGTLAVQPAVQPPQPRIPSPPRRQLFAATGPNSLLSAPSFSLLSPAFFHSFLPSFLFYFRGVPENKKKERGGGDNHCQHTPPTIGPSAGQPTSPDPSAPAATMDRRRRSRPQVPPDARRCSQVPARPRGLCLRLLNPSHSCLVPSTKVPKRRRRVRAAWWP